MNFVKTEIIGAYLINLDLKSDQRGFFARWFCEREFQDKGLETKFIQGNVSFNLRSGTLRGLHYQANPAAEVKIVRCLHGAVYDVVLDLRSRSATFGRYQAFELTAENRSMLYIPKGCAHGFMTLKEKSELTYLVSAFYAPETERGVRFDDPSFAIEWPMTPVEISEKDASYPDYEFG